MSFFRLFLFLWAVTAAASDYATYIGDSYSYTINAIAVDSSGNTYATGSRSVAISAGGQTSGDVFVTKIDTAGAVTLLATLSGKGSDQGNSIAVDSAGNIYVAGSTTSPDFPLFNALQTAAGQGPDAGTGFLTKMRPDGSIVYSTYIGGVKGASQLNAVATDAQGNAYVTGQTLAPDYPHTSGLPNDPAFGGGPGAISVAFFAKISPAGDRILYAGGIAGEGHACGQGSSCFLSTVANSGVAIALDPAGNAYIAGNTYGLGLATTPGALNSSGIGAFVFKVNAPGTALGYVTLLGSANNLPLAGAFPGSSPGNIADAIAVDSAGNAYVTGMTNDPKFPATAGSFQSQPNFTYPDGDTDLIPEFDAFAAKLDAAGTAMVWAGFLGNGGTTGQRITVDPADDVWISGVTHSSSFPATAAPATGGEFVTEFNPNGSALLYSTLLPGGTAQAGLAVDANGVLHLAGAAGLVSTFTSAQSPNARLFGVANAAGSGGGQLSGRVAPSEAISIYGAHLGVALPASGSYDSAGFLPTTLGGIRVTIGGIAAPLLYVSDTQINAVVPGELKPGSAVEMQVSNSASLLPTFRMMVDQAIPAVFLAANGTAAAINQDGTVNSASNPAASGSIVSVWATGAGYQPGADGQMATAARQTCSCVIATPANVLPTYAGAAPGMVNGIVQINFVVTAGFAPAMQYTLSVDGVQSYAFSVYVKP